MKRFAGIDIGSERHVVAVVDEHLAVLVKPTPFGEEAAGYQRLVELLGPPQDCLVAMEATGHYWRNLFAYLVSEGFSVAGYATMARHITPETGLVYRTQTAAGPRQRPV